MKGRKTRRYRPSRVVLVGFVGAERRFTGDLMNISSSGMLVKCTEDVEPGVRLRAGIEVGLEIFRAGVVVRRRVPEAGIAFEFVNMSTRDRQKLHQLLGRISKPV